MSVKIKFQLILLHKKHNAVSRMASCSKGETFFFVVIIVIIVLSA
jgi:hypothetical protein